MTRFKSAGCEVHTNPPVGAVVRDERTMALQAAKRNIDSHTASSRRGKISDDELIEFLKAGLTKAEIADRCGLSNQTIGVKVRNLMPVLEELGIEVVKGRPGTKMRISDSEMDREILRCLEAGLCKTEIVNEYTISRTTLDARIRKLEPDIKRRGIVITKKKGARKRKFSDEDLLRDLEAGWTGAEIARWYSVSRSTIRDHVRRIMPIIESKGITVAKYRSNLQ